MYKDRGDNQKALECHMKSLSIHLNTLGEDHPNAATSYNNIGNVYKVNNELEQALEYYTKSLSIRLNTPEKDHDDVTRVKENIASLGI